VAAIPVLDRSAGVLPTGAAQRSLYFLQQLRPDSPAYNTVEALRLRGPVDPGAWRAALAAVLARHEVLRTTVRLDDDGPVLVPAPALVAGAHVPVHRAAPGDGEALLARLAARPFDLDAELPVRLDLVRVAEREHLLLLVTHHIAADAWSCRLLVAELLAAHDAAGAAGPPPAVQYADVVAAREAAYDPAPDAAYWRQRLAGAPPLLELPRDTPRPAAPGDRGALRACPVPADLGPRLRAAAAAAGVTPFALLLTGFAHVLGRWAGADDVVVGAPVSERDRPEADGLVGCFVNTVPLRCDVGPAADRRDLVGRVSAAARADLEHAALPFDRLVAAVAPERSGGTGQVVQVLLNHHPATAPPPVRGLAVETVDVPRERAKFDLTCTVVEDGDRLTVTLDHAVDVLDTDTARRIAAHLAAVLDALVDDLDAPVGTLPTGASEPSPAAAGVVARPGRARGTERAGAVRARRPGASRPRRRPHPDRVGDLRAAAPPGPGARPRAGAAAARTGTGGGAGRPLRRAPRGRPGRDGRGRPYVPLDPRQPVAHLTAVIAAAGARLVLTAGPAPTPDGVAVLDLADAERADAERADAERADAERADAERAGATGPDPLPGRPEDVQYVLFTSGSTGAPKGVQVEYRHLSAYTASFLHRMRLPDGLHYALVSTMAADLGLLNVLGALATGGTLHVLPHEHATDPALLAAYLRAHPVDVIKLVPSHLAALAEGAELADLLPRRHLVLAGEACPWDLVDAVRVARPDLTVWNHYGPTETTVSVLAHEVPDTPPAARGATVPLGRPFDHVRVAVVDRDLRPVPDGAPGELLVSGASVARGYLAGPGGVHAADAARFVAGPAYRTGDRVRRRADGALEFLGRIDRQVKIRGYRVEPGHVESALRRHPDVADARVVVRPGPVLVAHPVLRRAADPAELVAFLRDRLPPHLVPAAVVPIERIPVTANGKLDESALPLPDPTARTAPAARPRDARDAALAATFADVLGVADVGIDDDFLALGGTSLTAIRLARRAGAVLGRDVRVVQVFQHPTVRRLADATAAAPTDGPGELLARLPGRTGAPPSPVALTVVAVPFGGGTAAGYADLARALPADVALYAVELPGHDPAGADEELQPYDDLADRVVAEVRQRIGGPVVVYGHCVGAALAWAVAHGLAGTDEAAPRGDGPRLVGLVAGGAFPAPRLPGRLAAAWGRIAPRDRWRGDRLYRDMLRAAGGLGGPGADPDEPPPVRISAVRHDAREAEEVWSRACHAPDLPRRVRVLAVVGEHDRDTEFPHERVREWELIGRDAELAVVRGPGTTSSPTRRRNWPGS
jgi:amino acid adenylation domain-containing protein